MNINNKLATQVLEFLEEKLSEFNDYDCGCYEHEEFMYECAVEIVKHFVNKQDEGTKD